MDFVSDEPQSTGLLQMLRFRNVQVEHAYCAPEGGRRRDKLPDALPIHELAMGNQKSASKFKLL